MTSVEVRVAGGVPEGAEIVGTDPALLDATGSTVSPLALVTSVVL
jgi:hypothetical protein